MQAMGLKSPAPIQSRLKHLQEKGYISWQEGKARTMQIVDEIIEGVPIMGSVAAGGLIETYSDVPPLILLSSISIAVLKTQSSAPRPGTPENMAGSLHVSIHAARSATLTLPHNLYKSDEIFRIL